MALLWVSRLSAVRPAPAGGEACVRTRQQAAHSATDVVWRRRSSTGRQEVCARSAEWQAACGGGGLPRLRLCEVRQRAPPRVPDTGPSPHPWAKKDYGAYFQKPHAGLILAAHCCANIELICSVGFGHARGPWALLLRTPEPQPPNCRKDVRKWMYDFSRMYADVRFFGGLRGGGQRFFLAFA
jgi:hypothetical protein